MFRNEKGAKKQNRNDLNRIRIRNRNRNSRIPRTWAHKGLITPCMWGLWGVCWHFGWMVHPPNHDDKKATTPYRNDITRIKLLMLEKFTVLSPFSSCALYIFVRCFMLLTHFFVFLILSKWRFRKSSLLLLLHYLPYVNNSILYKHTTGVYFIYSIYGLHFTWELLMILYNEPSLITCNSKTGLRISRRTCLMGLKTVLVQIKIGYYERQIFRRSFSPNFMEMKDQNPSGFLQVDIYLFFISHVKQGTHN